MCIVTHIFYLTLLLQAFPISHTTFSHLDLHDADNIKIIHPRIIEKTVRRRRDIQSNIYFEETGKLKVIEVGDWAVQLNFQGNFLVAPGLKTEWIGGNGASRVKSLKQCDYRMGAVLGLENASTAALTLCGRLITGYVNVAGNPYFILPLNDTSGAHILYTSKSLDARLKRSLNSNNFFSSEFSTSSEHWLYNLTGDTIDIDGDKDEIELTQRFDEDISSTSSSNDEGEPDISVAGGNSSTDELLPHRRNWHREQLDDEDSGYFYDTAWTAGTVYIRKRGGFTLPTRWLEIAVAVDHTLISFHGRNKVEQYVLALMNIVSAIYQDPSLEANLKLVVTRLVLYENKKQSIIRPGNAKKSLENVNLWNKRLHMSLAPGEPRHDLAIWLTRSDIGGPSGYAPVAGVCDPKRSCALNRDEGLSSAFIIAHESAHMYAMCRAFDITEPCSHLWCGNINTPFVCKTKKGPPLEGTECEFGKWCINGYCEEVGHRNFGRVPVVLNPQDGGWSEWSPWGTCSRSCGIGVEFHSRKCNNPIPSYGGKNCEGNPEEWRICNKNPCSEPLTDLRAQQCRRMPTLLNLNGKLEGNLTWLPYESEQDDMKCKLICVSEETKELYVTSENLLDGSPCSYEITNSICIQGKCHKVGCDGELDSQLETDKCGICGGNNSNCTEIKSSIERKLKREVSRVSVLPRMAREIKVEINVTMYHSDDPAVAFILKNRRKKKYVITIPNTIVHTEIIEGTKFFYRKYGNKHNIWAKGPVLAEMIIILYAPISEIQSGLNVSLKTEYDIHKSFLIPSKRYVWIMGGWGPCSASCGGGRRQKTTACWDNQNNRMVRRKFCSLLQKPVLESEKCNTFGCNFQWVASEWEPCTSTCGTQGIQNRELYCVPNTILTKMLYQNDTLEQIWKYMVSPNKCSGMAPASVRFCNRKPCFSYWTFGNWSQCSTSCGSGVSTRYADCPPPEGESFFTCGEAPPFQRRVCIGPFNRHNNRLCKGRKKKHCNGDGSNYCSLPVLAKYCKVGGFRRLCCRSCDSFHLSPISV